jgi:hypothetical protein
MISKRKIAAMILFLLMSLFMFTFANPAGNPEENLIPEEEINEEEPTPVIPEPVTPPVVVIPPIVDDEELVLDTTAPIIVINGGDVIIRIGDTYIDQGATVTDDTDEDVSLVTSTNLSTNIRGSYIVTYNATDSSGNVATPQVRNVYVVDVSDLEAAIEEGTNVLDDTIEQDVSDELADLLDQLEDALLEGEDVISDLLSEQPIVDDATDIINDLLDQIYNLNFEVRFIDFNDELIESVTVKYKETAIAPSNPTRLGYTFTSWDSGYTNIMNNKTVKAVYSANTNTPYGYEIYLEDLEGNYDLSFVYERNGTTDTNAIITPEAFTGFRLNNDLSVLTGNINADGSLVLRAYYTREIYTLTYEVEDETIEPNTQTYKFESSVTPLDAPTKIGHTFNGWVGIPMSVTEDVTITGSFSINSYNAVFKINDEVYATVPFDFNEQIVAPAYEVPTGYTFSGWGTLPVMGSSNVEFNATLTINSYNAVFKINDEVYATVPFDFNEQIVAPAYEVPTGYTFSGWGTLPVMGSSNVEFNATLTINSYNAVFKINDELYATVPFDFNEQIVAPAYEVPTGYTFSGWGTLPVMGSSNVEFNATLTINSYNAVFKINDEVYATVPFDFSEQIVAPAYEVPTGYTFSGWGTLPVMGSSNVEFNATLTINSYNAVFKINDEVYATVPFDFNEQIVAPAYEVPTGYTFSGWGTLPVMGSSNVEFNATLTINSYNAVFKINDEVYATVPFDFNEQIVAPAYEVPTGYTFSGWGTLPVMGSSNVEFNATLTINSYNAVFKINDEVYATVPFDFNEQIVAPAYEVPTGYTFSGWGTLPVMGSSNVEFNATLTLNEVNLINLTATLVPINYIVGDAMGSLNVIAHYDNGTSLVLSSSEYVITRSFNSSAVTEVSDYVEVSYEGLTARAYYDVYANASSGFIRLTRQSGGIFVEYWPHASAKNQIDVYYIYSETPLSGTDIRGILLAILNGDKEELTMAEAR